MLKLPENSDSMLSKDRESITRFKRFSESMGMLIAGNKPYHPLSNKENIIDARDRFAKRSVPGFQIEQDIGQVSRQPSHVRVHDSKYGGETVDDLGA